MKISILDDYQKAIANLQCLEILNGHDVQILSTYYSSPQQLANEIGTADALVLNRTRTPITGALLSLLPNLKLVSQTGKNAGHIDIAACTSAGVAVAESKGDPIATAELTWALIMNGLRLLPQAIDKMKTGAWQTNLGRRVHGKTIGIWGYGRIGQMIAKYASIFGADVLIWGRPPSRQKAHEDGYRAARSKQAFFAETDVVSMHLRLKAATKGIITLKDLLTMKQDALFVNTARAALVEKDALLTALQNGRPGYAAIDVFDEEPILDAAHPLLNLPNVICTPHLGYVERESYELYFSQAFENVVSFFAGAPTNIANPEVLS